jgi:hypothetical protein
MQDIVAGNPGLTMDLLGYRYDTGPPRFHPQSCYPFQRSSIPHTQVNNTIATLI